MNGLTGNVFITGGAGFIARAIYRRARAEQWSASFTAFSRDDSKHEKLKGLYPEVRIIRGDIAGTPEDRLASLMAGHSTVIHAAAVKYVDLAETQAWDTVRVNIEGSQNVARAAIQAGVAQVVAISTDKACQPSNTYGATKFMMERLFQELAVSVGPCDSLTNFTVTRYGNVLGSTGSVVTKWRTAIANGEPIRVTNPNHTRFWMSADEAVDLILLALNRNIPPGSLVVPGELKANTILQLAAALGGDSKNLTIVGDRPGEKVHETIMTANERWLSFLVEDARINAYVLPPAGSARSREQGRPSGTPYSLTSEDAHLMLPAEMLAIVKDSESI